MVSVTITKKGVIEFDYSLEVDEIALVYFTSYVNIYNISKPTKYITKGVLEDGNTKVHLITIDPGYYTSEEIKKLTNDEVIIDPNTLKISVPGTLTGGLKEMIKDDFVYLAPLNIFVYIDGIDMSTNLFNGKKSSLLTAIPIGNSSVGEIFQYTPSKDMYKKMYKGRRNKIQIALKDEYGNDFNAKFIMEISLR